MGKKRDIDPVVESFMSRALKEVEEYSPELGEQNRLLRTMAEKLDPLRAVSRKPRQISDEDKQWEEMTDEMARTAVEHIKHIASQVIGEFETAHDREVAEFELTSKLLKAVRTELVLEAAHRTSHRAAICLGLAAAGVAIGIGWVIAGKAHKGENDKDVLRRHQEEQGFSLE